MKKITIYIVMAVLCLNFTAIAQDNKAVDVTAGGIQIGQKVPDVTITGLHNYKDANGKPATIAKLSDFKGKLLILDFWATWCSPCVAMIPKMDSLQKVFGDKIQLLSVTYQSESEALPFLEKFEKQQKRNYDLPVVTDSKVLNKLFPHTYLPHYVWIDSNSVVKAITGQVDINYVNINSMLINGETNASVKNDVPVVYDKSKPLLLTAGKYQNHILKQSTFTGYIEGVGRGSTQNFFSNNDLTVKWLTARNHTILELFRIAYRKEQKEILIEVSNKSKLSYEKRVSENFKDWLKSGNAFSYEVVLNKSIAERGFDFMRNDLNNYFDQYDASIESRKTKCLVLIRTSNKDKIRTTGGTPIAKFDGFGAQLKSCYLNVFIARMQFYLQAHPLPLVDETNYKEMADIDLKASLSNVADVNKALEKYDLQLIEKEAFVDMLVMKDRKSNKPPNN